MYENDKIFSIIYAYCYILFVASTEKSTQYYAKMLGQDSGIYIEFIMLRKLSTFASQCTHNLIALNKKSV
jgi:hypothetical protein